MSSSSDDLTPEDIRNEANSIVDNILPWLVLLLMFPPSESRRHQSSNDVIDELFDGRTIKKIYSVYNLMRRLATPLGFDISIGKGAPGGKVEPHLFIPKQIEHPEKHERLNVQRGDTTILDLKVAPNLDRVHNYLKSKDVYLRVRDMVGKAAAFVKGFQSETGTVGRMPENKLKSDQKKDKMIKRQGSLLAEDEVLVRDINNERKYRSQHRKHDYEPEDSKDVKKDYEESLYGQI